MAYNNRYVFKLTMMSCRLLISCSPLKTIRNKAIGPGVALFSSRLQAQKLSPPAQTALVQTLVPLRKLTSVGNIWASDVF